MQQGIRRTRAMNINSGPDTEQTKQNKMQPVTSN